MKIKQLSLFLENKPGSMSVPCRVLSKAGINLITLTLADTQQFGILRIIVQEWEKAQAVLQKAGCIAKVTEVLAIEVPDRPGGLIEILDAVEKTGINVEYMYAFTLKQGDKGVLVFRFDDPDKVIKTLKAKKINIVDEVELFKRLKG